MPDEPRLPVATGTGLSALDARFRSDPHDVIDDLRKREPVHRDRVFDRVVLTRNDDIGMLLKDTGMASDPRKSCPGSFARVQFGVDENFRPTMLHMDDPDHRRLRGLVTKAFNRHSVEKLRPVIQGVASALLDAVQDQTRFDIIAAFASPLPIIIIAGMLGVDPADQTEFQAWSDAQVHMFNPMRSVEQAAQLKWAEAELNRYLATTMNRRKVAPQDDLISHLLAAEENGEQLDEAEIISVCRLLLVAGNVTTRDLIGNGVVALLTHPAALASLRREPDRIAATVEEILRFDSPVVQVGRQNVEARQVGGCPIKPGQSMMGLLLAANHDPECHVNPHIFDIDRANNHHLSFGGGAHFCLGASLARAEGQIAISTLLSRFPHLRLEIGSAPARKAIPSLNGFDAIWVEVGPAAMPRLVAMKRNKVERELRT